jgi:hypothetical protein
MSQLTTYLKNLIEEEGLKETLDKLLELSRIDSKMAKHETNYIQLKGQFRRLQKDEISGTVSASNLQMRHNQVYRNTLAYIDDIKSSINLPAAWTVDGDGDDSDTTPANQSGSNSTGSAQLSDGLTRVLMLQANPRGTVRLNLDREHADIQSELSGVHASFQLIPRRDVRITELNQEIIRERPQIVHFSGHGRSSKPSALDPNDPFAEPQPGETGGLLLVNPSGDGLFPAPAAALAFMFKSMVEQQEVPLSVVFLNACYSGEQAEAISQHIPYVIGTSDAVLDDAAWVFSKGFYFSLANQAGNEINEEAVRKAFNAGQMNAIFMGEPEDRFMLYVNGELQ